MHCPFCLLILIWALQPPEEFWQEKESQFTNQNQVSWGRGSYVFSKITWIPPGADEKWSQFLKT